MINRILLNAKILIVDDQKANVDILTGFLEMEGYSNILGTTDSRKAIALFDSFNPDLVLLDLMMPYLNGFQILEQLKSLISPDTFLPVLVLTADISIESKQRALTAGAKDFLVKPFDLIEVGLRIRNLLETRSLYLQLADRNRVLDENVRDRTRELERTNQDLVMARDKAEESNRLKAAFMQNISHEVRTPLNSILGFGTLLAESTIPDEEKKRFIPLMQSSSNRLINTITDYMDISLIAAGTLEVRIEPVDLVAEMKDIRDKYEVLARARKLSLVLEGQVVIEHQAFIQTDLELFRKILNHLVDNAIKFTHEGSVTAGYVYGPDTVDIFVRDTGIGIDPEVREKIFDVFMQEDYSPSRGHEGSGLGLSIIRGFLKLLGGEIRMESVKNQGSTFTITLPIGEGRVRENEIEAPGRQISETLPVVLVADDEISNLTYLEMILEPKSSKVFTAVNGREAVALCRAHPEISLVLMDIKMPLMNGLEATAEIKSFRKELPVIAVTAFAMWGDEKKINEAGCDGYIAKPFSKEKLYASLKQYGFTA